MITLTISLSEALKSLVDQQVTERGFGTCSAYVHALIRKDLDAQALRGLLLQGAQSGPAAAADAGYFDDLRARVRCRQTP